MKWLAAREGSEGKAEMGQELKWKGREEREDQVNQTVQTPQREYQAALCWVAREETAVPAKPEEMDLEWKSKAMEAKAALCLPMVPRRLRTPEYQVLILQADSEVKEDWEVMGAMEWEWKVQAKESYIPA
jgi:hypothetical protein